MAKIESVEACLAKLDILAAAWSIHTIRDSAHRVRIREYRINVTQWDGKSQVFRCVDLMTGLNLAVAALCEQARIDYVGRPANA